MLILLYFACYIKAIGAEFVFTYRKVEKTGHSVHCFCDRDSGNVCDLVTRILDRSSCALIGEAAHAAWSSNIYRRGGFLALPLCPPHNLTNFSVYAPGIPKLLSIGIRNTLTDIFNIFNLMMFYHDFSTRNCRHKIYQVASLLTENRNRIC